MDVVDEMDVVEGADAADAADGAVAAVVGGEGEASSPGADAPVPGVFDQAPEGVRRRIDAAKAIIEAGVDLSAARVKLQVARRLAGRVRPDAARSALLAAIDAEASALSEREAALARAAQG